MTQHFVWCTHYVVMTSLGTSQSHFLKYITWFSYALLSSNFFYDCMFHLTFSYDTSNEWALKKLSFDVPVTYLWRHMWRHQIVFWMHITIFVRSSVFLLLLWVHDAFDFQLQVTKWIGIQLALVWCTHNMIITSLVASESRFQIYDTIFVRLSIF